MVFIAPNKVVKVPARSSSRQLLSIALPQLPPARRTSLARAKAQHHGATSSDAQLCDYGRRYSRVSVMLQYTLVNALLTTFCNSSHSVLKEILYIE